MRKQNASMLVGAILNVTFLRARITYHQESAGKIPTERGMGSALLSPRPHSFRFKKKNPSPPKLTN